MLATWEDCGKRNSALGVSFRMTLRGLIAQNEYSHPRKVHRKDTPNALFRVPKSSFGEHKLFQQRLVVHHCEKIVKR